MLGAIRFTFRFSSGVLPACDIYSTRISTSLCREKLYSFSVFNRFETYSSVVACNSFSVRCLVESKYKSLGWRENSNRAPALKLRLLNLASREKRGGGHYCACQSCYIHTHTATSPTPRAKPGVSAGTAKLCGSPLSAMHLFVDRRMVSSCRCSFAVVAAQFPDVRLVR